VGKGRPFGRAQGKRGLRESPPPLPGGASDRQTTLTTYDTNCCKLLATIGFDLITSASMASQNFEFGGWKGPLRDGREWGWGLGQLRGGGQK